ncbi:MAG: hypothetical protein IJW22_02840, partial [Clostridia bacterium]|nr:hypothetical protein [Clostridia bacterium]
MNELTKEQIHGSVRALCEAARAASHTIALADNEKRGAALCAVAADGLKDDVDVDILCRKFRE